MLVIDVPHTGGPEVLTAVDRPIPTPGPGEVLIRVAAAGVNRPDLMQRAGIYPMPPGAPTVPGLEVAGTVAKAGPGVTAWKTDEPVCALLVGGGYAEYCVVPQGQCMRMPQGLTPAEAACLPEAAFTAWSALVERGQLRAGEWLLVHGGTSGVGSLAIQWARHLGARVITTAGDDEKCRYALTLGAEVAINYRNEVFEKAVLEKTGGAGANVVLDMVGGPYFARNLACLATDGRMVYIAHPLGRELAVDIGLVMLKRAHITGTTLRHRSIAQKDQIARELEATLWPAIAAGKVRPVVNKSFRLAEAADAHRYLESGQNIGKIVLTVS
ncbi:MAG: NAD(P)H-quinone oxidoreductase [Pseudomonadota bacterium]